MCTKKPTWTKAAVTPGTERAAGVMIGVKFLYHYRKERIFMIAFQKNIIPERRRNLNLVGYYKPGGWKIHISATPDSAPTIFELVIPVLVSMRVWHKYVILDQFHLMTGTQAGKFITIYPNPDDEGGEHGWRMVLAKVKAAVIGRVLDQPKILDDREVFVDPDNNPLPTGISMRFAEDFNSDK